ncbi:hypothetical protein J2X01_004049 [Arthrobacter ginsengisoli]|uniref:Uncharacterized protein n=1 Tax=Arthrobacter ginsengisoli TaxID=1356565 RepID=A0ABU1UHT2_9MICC|nr:hypothetical protein [Arthrobacter ginsengisoli]
MFGGGVVDGTADVRGAVAAALPTPGAGRCAGFNVITPDCPGFVWTVNVR